MDSGLQRAVVSRFSILSLRPPASPLRPPAAGTEAEADWIAEPQVSRKVEENSHPPPSVIYEPSLAPRE